MKKRYYTTELQLHIKILICGRLSENRNKKVYIAGLITLIIKST